MRGALALLVVVLAAGCAGSDAAAPEERPERFALRVTTLLRMGDFAAAWAELHPAHQEMVTRGTLRACWTMTDDVLADPAVDVEVVRVADEDWEIPGTDRTEPSKAITVRALGAGGGVLETWTQHAFAVDDEPDRWGWILAPALLADAQGDVC